MGNSNTRRQPGFGRHGLQCSGEGLRQLLLDTDHPAILRGACRGTGVATGGRSGANYHRIRAGSRPTGPPHPHHPARRSFPLGRDQAPPAPMSSDTRRHSPRPLRPARPCPSASASTPCSSASAPARRARSFAATDDFHGREVALKRVRIDLSGENATYQQHFYLAEAALVGRLRHPNVVEILDAVNDPGRPLCGDGVRAGPDLAALLRARQAAAAGPDRRDRLQVRDGARLRGAPGHHPPRHQARQPAGQPAPRPGEQCQGERFRQRLGRRRRDDAGLPRGLADLHVARADRRQPAHRAGRHVLAGRGALPAHRRAPRPSKR